MCTAVTTLSTLQDCEDLEGSSNLRQDDIIIAIMGPTGSGKSTLVDTLTRQPGKRVGHGLQSCTSEVNAVRIKGHPQHGDRIVLVDTPGFNDTNKTDFVVLELISKWLVQLWNAEIFLCGVLYLHRITDIRLTGTDRRTMVMFEELCGTEAAKIVHFVTTMWDDVEHDVGEEREAHFRAELWRPMLLHGASTARFLNTSESAWEIIENTLSKLPAENVSLQLQVETVQLKRALGETKAAQTLNSAGIYFHPESKAAATTQGGPPSSPSRGSQGLWPTDDMIHREGLLNSRSRKMVTAVITFLTPQEYDLRGLAETTRQSLQLLKPWTLLKPNPNDALVGEITTQAAKYVSAIQMSVSAAYSGFTVAEEVLFLAHALPIEDKEDLQHYLVGMAELAREAKENANNAYTVFRDVRGEVFADTVKMQSQEEKAKRVGTGSNPATREDLPRYSKKDLDTLMKFAEHISKFANWWDWVKVETDLSRPDLPIIFQIDTLNDPEVVKRWNHIRQKYTAYVQMIGEIEDSDPQFFSCTSVASQLEQSADAGASATTERPSSPGTSASRPQTEAPPVPPKPQAEPTATIEKADPSPNPPTDKQSGTRNNKIKKQRKDTPDGDCTKPANLGPPADKQSGTRNNKIKKQRKDTPDGDCTKPANLGPPTDKESGTWTNKIKKQRKDISDDNCTKPANLGTRYMTKFTKVYPKVAKRVFRGLNEGVKSAHSPRNSRVARRRDTQYPTSPSGSSPKASFEHPKMILDGSVFSEEPEDISMDVLMAAKYLAPSTPDN